MSASDERLAFIRQPAPAAPVVTAGKQPLLPPATKDEIYAFFGRKKPKKTRG
mgnify:FL=1